jgi:hypothetical protein
MVFIGFVLVKCFLEMTYVVLIGFNGGLNFVIFEAISILLPFQTSITTSKHKHELTFLFFPFTIEICSACGYAVLVSSQGSSVYVVLRWDYEFGLRIILIRRRLRQSCGNFTARAPLNCS